MMNSNETVLINVASPIKRKEIRTLLEAQKSPSYHYLKMISSIEMQFEVKDDGSHGDLCAYTTGLIYHGLPYGNVLTFRVLYDGQFFAGGPVYPKDSDIYRKIHHHRS